MDYWRGAMLVNELYNALSSYRNGQWVSLIMQDTIVIQTLYLNHLGFKNWMNLWISMSYVYVCKLPISYSGIFKYNRDNPDYRWTRQSDVSYSKMSIKVLWKSPVNIPFLKYMYGTNKLDHLLNQMSIYMVLDSSIKRKTNFLIYTKAIFYM